MTITMRERERSRRESERLRRLAEAWCLLFAGAVLAVVLWLLMGSAL